MAIKLCQKYHRWLVSTTVLKLFKRRLERRIKEFRDEKRNEEALIITSLPNNLRLTPASHSRISTKKSCYLSFQSLTLIMSRYSCWGARNTFCIIDLLKSLSPLRNKEFNIHFRRASHTAFPVMNFHYLNNSTPFSFSFLFLFPPPKENIFILTESRSFRARIIKVVFIQRKQEGSRGERAKNVFWHSNCVSVW